MDIGVLEMAVTGTGVPLDNACGYAIDGVEVRHG